MTPSDKCIDLVKSFEGYAKKRADGGCDAYPDPASGGDPWTIGYGSTGDSIRRGTVWTRQQADERFASDLAKFGVRVEALLGGALTTQHQFDALVSFAYNLGLGNLASSTLLRKHRARDFEGAANEFLKWDKAQGKVMAGLTKRRAAERALYRLP
jgi:lysozyme